MTCNICNIDGLNDNVDGKTVFNHKIDFGILGAYDLSIDYYLFDDRGDDGKLGPAEQEFYISLARKNDDVPIINKNLSFRFCPFCGKRLREGRKNK